MIHTIQIRDDKVAVTIYMMDMDAVLTNQHPGPELSLYTFSP